MEYIGKEILSGELIPVLLGISREADETAKRMFRQYNVISHVFCERASFPRRIFSLCMKYHPVRHTAGDRLMVTALEDFAVQHATADVILYLIPCTEEYVNLVWHHRATLEAHYVIASPEEIRRVWFGNDLKKSPRKEK